MKLYTSAAQLIGRTPLLQLCTIEKNDGLNVRLLAKLEARNPAGSAKDRVALNMIDDAEKRGILKPGATIIEPSLSTGSNGSSWSPTRASRESA